MSELVFDIFAIDRASAVFTRVGASAERSAMSVQAAQRKMSEGFLMAGAIAVGVGVKSLEMASNFDAATTKIVALGAESPRSMKMVSQGILEMTSQVGASAQELADAMYFIEGSGFHGAKGLNVLSAAAKGAAIENANVTDVARAVSGLLKDYTGHSLTAAQATNAMSGAVAHGGLSFQELAEAIPNVGSRAAAANIPISELLGAIAKMTTDQLPASKAATYLGQTIGQLAAPSGHASKAMADLGINAMDVSRAITSGSGHGLADALKILNKGTENAGKAGETAYAALAKSVGGVKSLQGALMLGGKNAEDFGKTVDDIAAKIKAGGKEIDGFNLTQETLKQKFHDTKGAASSLAIEIGQDLTPAANDVMTAFTGLFGYLTGHHDVLVALGVGVAGVAAAFTALKLVTASIAIVNAVMASSEVGMALGMTASAIAAGDLRGAMVGLGLAMDATPFGLAATAIGAVAAGAYLLVKAFHHSDESAKINQQNVKDLAGTYDNLTGSITASTSAMVANQLQGKKVFTYHQSTSAVGGKTWPVAGDSVSVFAMGSKMGLNQGDIIRAAQGQQKAIHLVQQAMARYARTSQVAAAEAKSFGQAMGQESGTVRKSADSARLAWLRTQDLEKSLKGVTGGTQLAHSAYIGNISDLSTLAAKHKWTGDQIQQVINAEWQPAMAKAQGITKTNVQNIVKTMNGLGLTAKEAMSAAGGDAADGLLHGFSPAIARMAAAAAEAYHAAERALRTAAQSKSPSRKMMAVGTDLGDGLVIGYQRSAGRLSTEAAKTMDKAHKAHMASLQKQENETERRLAAATARLAKVNDKMSAAQGWGQSFTGNVFGQTFDTTKTVNLPARMTTINGVNVMQSGGTKQVPADILGQMFSYQHKQHTQAKKLDREIKKLAGEGMSRSVLEQMAAGGEQGLAQIAALAGGTASQVHQFNSLVLSTAALNNDAGAEATNGTSYRSLLKEHHDDARAVTNIKKALHGIKIEIAGHGHHLRIT